MERQETSCEWCSVSHPLCLCLISAPWRSSILGGPAGPLVTGPAEAWGLLHVGALSAQIEIVLPTCTFVIGRQDSKPPERAPALELTGRGIQGAWEEAYGALAGGSFQERDRG